MCWMSCSGLYILLLITINASFLRRKYKDTGITFISVADLRIRGFSGSPLELLQQYVDSLGRDTSDAVVSENGSLSCNLYPFNLPISADDG